MGVKWPQALQTSPHNFFTLRELWQSSELAEPVFVCKYDFLLFTLVHWTWSFPSPVLKAGTTTSLDVVFAIVVVILFSSLITHYYFCFLLSFLKVESVKECTHHLQYMKQQGDLYIWPDGDEYFYLHPVEDICILQAPEPVFVGSQIYSKFDLSRARELFAKNS